MKERTKGFISGVIVAVLLMVLAGGVFAASQTIEISPIKVMVNGEEFRPKDAGGNDVLVFVYNGTTYAPLRALAETFGLEVGYDSNAKMATVVSASASSPAAPSAPSTFTLGVGTYTAGVDISSGKYDVTAISGSGNFQGNVASCQFGSLNEILAAPGASSSDRPSTYSNLTLADGDILYIKGSLNLQFSKK